MLRIKNGLVEYQEPDGEIEIKEEEDIKAITLSKWKTAGREDHPLTYQFIKELFKNEENRNSGDQEKRLSGSSESY